MSPRRSLNTQFAAGRREQEADNESEVRSRPHRPPEEYSEVIRTAKTDRGFLPTFLVQPKNVYFDSQDSNERILLMLRKHVVTNVPWVTGVILGLLMPIVFTYFPVFIALPANYQIVSVMIWYLLIFGYAFEAFLGWYYHVFIITDERIIDYDFYSLLYKKVSKAKIDRIEDVTYQMGGVLQSVFHFGHVYVQTAGAEREFQFEAVPNPEVVTRLLNELIMEEEREKHEGRIR